jgi:hypothetical protein
VQGHLFCGGGLLVDAGDALQEELMHPNLPAPWMTSSEGFGGNPVDRRIKVAQGASSLI